MQRLWMSTAGYLGLITAVFVLIVGAVRYNLSAVTAVIENETKTIVIDAGHGGEDGGTTGAGGTSESRINLEVSLRLEQLLQFCGFQTSMIRTSDTSVYTQGQSISERKVSDLKNRVAMVNREEPAILISIHQNHFPQEQYSGAQVFYASTEGSRKLAELTQQLLRQTLNPDNNRACKQASSVYLLEQIHCPAILVECGFLSNHEEELKLQQSQYQKRIVCAIAGALAQYTSEGDSNIEV